MRHSHLTLIATLALTLAACGSDNDAASTTNPPVTAAPTTVAPTTVVPTTDAPTTTTPGPAGGSTSQDTRELTGIRWVLDGFITVGGPDTVPTGIEAALTFDGAGHVSVQTSCNQGSADVTFADDGMITFGPVTLTKMACSDASNSVETRIVSLLGEPSYWSAHDGTLSLYPANITDTGMLFHSA